MLHLGILRLIKSKVMLVRPRIKFIGGIDFCKTTRHDIVMTEMRISIEFYNMITFDSKFVKPIIYRHRLIGQTKQCHHSPIDYIIHIRRIGGTPPERRGRRSAALAYGRYATECHQFISMKSYRKIPKHGHYGHRLSSIQMFSPKLRILYYAIFRYSLA